MADGTVKILTDLSTEGFKNGLSKMGSIAKTGLKAVTTSVTAISGALTTAGGYAVKVGSDFEAGMSEVAAISGATSGDLEALTAKAKEMGASTKFSATESAEALKYMAMAGWDTQSMLGGLPGVMNLAAASGEDLGAVSDILTDSMTAFGLAADQSEHFADVLAKASSSSNTNVGLMGETFKYVAPVAGALGFSVEDTATAIGLMANAGIKGSQAGTALRSMFSRLAKPTDEVQGAMDALGVSLTNADGSMKTLGDIMGDLRNGFAGLSEAEKAEMASSLAGQEAMSGLLAMVNTSDEDFAKLQDSIYNADGAAQQMADTMNDNLQGAVTIAKSALEGLGISVYEGLQEPLKNAVQTGTGYLNDLQAAFDEGGIQGAVGALGGIFADVVTQIAGAAPGMIDAAVSLIDNLLTGLEESLPQLAQSGVDIVESLLSAFFTVFPKVISMGNELVVDFAQGIVEGLPALVDQGVQMVDSICNSVTSTLPQLITAAQRAIPTLVQGLAKVLPKLADTGLNVIAQLATGIAHALPDLIPAAVDIITSMYQTLVDNLPLLLDAALQLVQGLAQGIIKAIPKLIAALPQLIQGIVDFLIDGIPMLIDTAIQLVDGIVAALPDIIQALIDALPQIIESLITGFISCIGQLVEMAIQLVVALVTHLPEIIAGLIEAIPQIITAIIDGFMNSLDQFVECGGQIINALWEGIKAVWETLVEWFTVTIPNLIENIGTWFSELPGKVGQWFTQLFNFVVSWGSDMWSKAKEIGKNFIDGIVNFIKTLPQNVSNWLKNVLSKAADFVGSFGKKALEAGKSFFDNIVNAVKKIPGQMLSIGKNIVSGIWNGISGAAKWLWDQISGFCSGIVDNIKGFFGIHSPSTLMADEIGRFLPPGISRGFEKALPKAEKDIQSGLSDMVDDLSPPMIPIDVMAQVRKSGVLDNLTDIVNSSASGITANARAQVESDRRPVLSSDPGQTKFEQVNNFYSAGVTSPAEAARQTRNATRQLLTKAVTA